KFSQSSEKLEKLLGMGRPRKDKSGLGYDKFKIKLESAIPMFEKSTASGSKTKTTHVYHSCGDSGHYKSECISP
ncbi:hypothetical protein PJP10_32640, partial [Mycobacterium kansasii]